MAGSAIFVPPRHLACVTRSVVWGPKRRACHLVAAESAAANLASAAIREIYVPHRDWDYVVMAMRDAAVSAILGLIPWDDDWTVDRAAYAARIEQSVSALQVRLDARLAEHDDRLRTRLLSCAQSIPSDDRIIVSVGDGHWEVDGGAMMVRWVGGSGQPGAWRSISALPDVDHVCRTWLPSAWRDARAWVFRLWRDRHEQRYGPLPVR